MSSLSAATVTVSTSKSAGVGNDESGPAMEKFVESIGGSVIATRLIPDDRATIEETLRELSDHSQCDLILTSGGTGFSPDDVTPEATRAVIDREAPGIAEAIRIGSQRHTPHWMLSRGVAGIRGTTVIVNFPGSPRSIEQAGEAIATALPHAIRLLQDSETTHDTNER